jgi:hypothetical protein
VLELSEHGVELLRAADEGGASAQRLESRGAHVSARRPYATQDLRQRAVDIALVRHLMGKVRGTRPIG